MPDADRLARLVTELGADERYAVGSRRFPLPVSDDEGVAIAAALAEEFDHGCEERARLAAAQGLTIYCHAGCSSCCDILVMAYRPETLAIARFLRRPENAAAREGFLRRYSAWREASGDVPERLSALFVAGKQAAYDALHTEHFRRRIRCAFNEEGRCTIYPVRPIACRNAHALDTDSQCVADPPEGRPAAAVDFVPLSRFMKDALRILRATHNATTTRRHEQESICAAVHRSLSPAQRSQR
jgi:Fe-S-cluster containining protein